MRGCNVLVMNPPSPPTLSGRIILCQGCEYFVACCLLLASNHVPCFPKVYKSYASLYVGGSRFVMWSRENASLQYRINRLQFPALSDNWLLHTREKQILHLIGSVHGLAIVYSISETSQMTQVGDRAVKLQQKAKKPKCQNYQAT